MREEQAHADEEKEEADDDTHTATLRLQGTGPKGAVTATVTATLEPVPSGTRLRYHYVMGPGASGTSVAIEANPDKHARIVRRRLVEMKANMQRTVAGIKELAESPTAAPDDATVSPRDPTA